MKNLLFLLGVTLVLALGYACKKNDVVWPVAKNTGSNVNVNPGDTLDSVAVFTVAGSKAFPANTNNPAKETNVTGGPYPNSTTYSFTVSFQVFAYNDIDYTTPLYTSSYTGTLTQKFTLDSNALQVVIPIHYNQCIQRSLFLVSYNELIITSKPVRNPADTAGAPSGTPKSINKTDTTDPSLLPTQPPGSGAEANGSGKCESFTVGKTADGKSHMIFSQTGSAVLD